GRLRGNHASARRPRGAVSGVRDPAAPLRIAGEIGVDRPRVQRPSQASAGEPKRYRHSPPGLSLRWPKLTMPAHNAENERIKRGYFAHLQAARGLNESSIDAAARAIHRFEASTGFRSFKKFHIEQAIAFRRRLDDAVNLRTEKPLSKATVLQTLNAMRAFILWLAEQSGYRSRIRYSDADYFRLSEKDTRIAKAPQRRPIPTQEQIESVLRTMPAASDIEQRNRALIAFTWLTGVRDGALATLKLKHVNVVDGWVNQDP